MTRVSVPGKVILIGEHAAVYGRPALVAAIDLRTTVEIAPAEEAAARGGYLLALETIGRQVTLGRDDIDRARDEAARSWRAWSASDAPFVPPPLGREGVVVLAIGEARRVLAEAGHAAPVGVRVRVRSALPVGGGMGSSAAAATAVIAGLLRHAGRSAGAEVVEAAALEVERRQHGRPSGIDTATVLRGGALLIERTASGLRVEALALAQTALASLLPYDSGAPAETTGELVDLVRRRGQNDPAARDAALDTLTAAARELRRALEDARDPGPPVRAAHRALCALGVVPSAVAERIARIEAAGGSAKISGAGSHRGPGAGTVLVYHPEPARLVETGALDGWRRHHARFGAPGLTVER